MAGWKETIAGLYLKVARLEERLKTAEKEIKALKAAKAKEQ